MHRLISVLSPSDPDPHILERLATLKRVWLALAALIAGASLAVRLLPAVGLVLPAQWHPMETEAALAALLSTLSLRFAEQRSSRRMQRMSLTLVILVLVLCICALAHYRMPGTTGRPATSGVASLWQSGLSPQTAGCFILLGLSTMLAGVRRRLPVILADMVVICLCLLVLIVVSGYIFGVSHLFGLNTAPTITLQTVICLALLAQAALFLRCKSGVFSIFLGRGIGSRLARFFAPIMLVIQFLREGLRAHIIQSGRLPMHTITAILASLAGMTSLIVILFLAWRINTMEVEIHALSLRDALTGLYNLRGFRLLAEQSMRLAQRSGLPYSVLFVDLDNLKQINDSLGHSVGSEFLVETARILRITFRETDVIGRIGGDEFAVAGLFTEQAIAAAAQRLHGLAAERNAAAPHPLALSFSIGQATQEATVDYTLDELLAEADQSMYGNKRRRKNPLAETG